MVYPEFALKLSLLEVTSNKSIVAQEKAWSHQEQVITWANVDKDLCRKMLSLARISQWSKFGMDDKG